MANRKTTLPLQYPNTYVVIELSINAENGTVRSAKPTSSAVRVPTSAAQLGERPPTGRVRPAASTAVEGAPRRLERGDRGRRESPLAMNPSPTRMRRRPRLRASDRSRRPYPMRGAPGCPRCPATPIELFSTAHAPRPSAPERERPSA